MGPIGRALLAGAAILAGLSAAGAPAAAQPAAGVLYGSGNTLVTFDTDAPSTITSLRPITGLGAGEQIQAIDFRDRPAPGEPSDAQTLYGLAVVQGTTDTVRLYRIDVGDGAVTPVGPTVSGLPPSTAWDIDFDAASDQLRLVTDSDLNMRFDPDTGAVAGTGSNISPPGQHVEAIAFDERVPGRLTTLRGIVAHGELVSIGEGNGPDDGTLATFATSGLVATPGSTRMGYDYTPFDPSNPDGHIAFITLSTPLGTGALYRFGPNLGIFSVDFVGELGASLRAFALMPSMTAQFSASGETAAPGDRVTVTVTRGGPVSSSGSVAYATTGGTAVAGSDYVSAAGRLTFAPGETSKTFTVSVLPNAAGTHDKTVGLALSDPSAPLQLGPATTAVLTIHSPHPPVPPLLVAKAPSRLTVAALLRHGIVVRIRATVPVHALEVALVGTAVRAQLSRRGNLVLASRTYRGMLRTARVRLTPARGLVGRPRHGVRLRVEAVAEDATGRRLAASRVLRVVMTRR